VKRINQAELYLKSTWQRAVSATYMPHSHQKHTYKSTTHTTSHWSLICNRHFLSQFATNWQVFLTFIGNRKSMLSGVSGEGERTAPAG